MSAAYRARPEGSKRAVTHDPVPFSTVLLLALQLLLVAGGLVCSTLSTGRTTELTCDHQVATCVVSSRASDGKPTTITLLLAEVVDVRAQTESPSGVLERVVFIRAGGALVPVGEPHEASIVRPQVDQLRVFLSEPTAPYLTTTIDHPDVGPSFWTFASIAALLLLPMAFSIAIRRTVRVELDDVDRTLRIVSRGVGARWARTLRCDEVAGVVVERSIENFSRFRVAVALENGGRVPIVARWSRWRGLQQDTARRIERLLESA